MGGSICTLPSGRLRGRVEARTCELLAWHAWKRRRATPPPRSGDRRGKKGRRPAIRAPGGPFLASRQHGSLGGICRVDSGPQVPQAHQGRATEGPSHRRRLRARVSRSRAWALVFQGTRSLRGQLATSGTASERVVEIQPAQHCIAFFPCRSAAESRQRGRGARRAVRGPRGALRSGVGTREPGVQGEGQEASRNAYATTLKPQRASAAEPWAVGARIAFAM